MAPIKSFEMVTTNLKRTKAELRDVNSGTSAYEVDLSFTTTDMRSAKPGRHGIVLQTPSSSTNSNQQVLGTCDFSFSSTTTPIHLGFGDPVSSPESVTWEDMHIREIVKQSGFELSIDLGGDIGRKVFQWKRTAEVESKSALSQKMDWLHLKMVEVESGAVVARFVHNFMFGSKRGTFEFEQFEGGGDWDRVAVLSGLAVLEYMRKSQGWSW
ncbi:unnamed protein product [Aureobasidium uvarum]|uniref:Uncharacterized protein n=1 Tax=Aureobasidium uvarum TaxID=2773716 RepID=A0A9N8KM83_9PEZI|nr:unnamed protein product [Aureobasidium uvarum]